MSDQETKSADQQAPKLVETTKPAPAKVTAPANKKVKNPKRVAAGKALAAKNKERFAKIKALEKAEKEVEVHTQEHPAIVNEKSEAKQSWSTPLLVGGVVIVGGL
mgnify:CR=1 FL=1